MEKYFERIGIVLEQARKHMREPREEIMRVLPKTLTLWRCRQKPGWRPDEIIDLADYLFKNHNDLVGKRLSSSAIWRMEAGTGEYSLKALFQYAYILDIPFLPLEKIKEIGNEED